MKSTQTLKLHRRHLRWFVILAGLMMVLAALACEVPRLTNEQIAGLENEDFLEQLGGDPYIIAYPDAACPGEMVTVEWQGPRGQPDSCAIRPDTCYQGTVYSYPDVLRVEGTLGDSRRLMLDPSVSTSYWFYYSLLRGIDTTSGLSRSDDVQILTTSNPSGRVADVEHTYSLMCDPDTNTWTWDREDTSDHPWGNGTISACLGIVGTCSSVNTINLSTPDGAMGGVDPSNDYADGRCFPSVADNYAPQDVMVENTDPAYASVIGAPCSEGDQPPVADGMETFTMYYWMGCTNTLQGPAGDDCMMGTIDMITSNPDQSEESEDSNDEGGSSGPICFVASGDGVCCSEAGETHLTSPDDCPAPPPACGSPCASDAQCAGLGVNPTCAGGFCYDAQTCDTAGASSGGSDGGGSSSGGNNGGGSSAVCGNGVVESGEACDGNNNGSCNWSTQYCTNSCSCDTLE